MSLLKVHVQIGAHKPSVGIKISFDKVIQFSLKKFCLKKHIRKALHFSTWANSSTNTQKKNLLKMCKQKTFFYVFIYHVSCVRLSCVICIFSCVMCCVACCFLPVFCYHSLSLVADDSIHSHIPSPGNSPTRRSRLVC